MNFEKGLNKGESVVTSLGWSPPPIEVVPVKTETPGYVPIKDVKLVPPEDG